MPIYDAGIILDQVARGTNVLTYLHHEDLRHCFIQFFPYSKRCLEATQGLTRHLSEALRC